MRRPLLPIIGLLLGVPASAQLLAGEVPAGSTALQVGIDLQLNAPFSQDTMAFELDCDDFWDMTAFLAQGSPPIDAPNIAALRMLDDDLEVCTDLSDPPRPQYYGFGQPLTCTGDFGWNPDDFITLGDFGSFTSIGPTSIDSLYVAYRRGADLGWILLSFNVGLEVELQIHEVLSICPGTTDVEELERPALSVYPNPSMGGPLRLEGTGTLRSIELCDAAGRVLAQYPGNVRTIDAPEVAGTYLVRATQMNGRVTVTQLVRY